MNRRVINIIASLMLLEAVYIVFRYGLPAETGVTAAVNDIGNGHVIVIDPGHGGDDPGKVGKNDTIEKDINLSISCILRDMLEQEGYTVVMTRKDDNGLYKSEDGNKKAADMRERCRIIEESKAELVISIHQNSFTDSSVCGAQVFYYRHSDKGRQLAEIIQSSMKVNVDNNNTRSAKSNDSYYMLIHTACPTVIVECGFLSNSQEAAMLSDKKYQTKTANGIKEGINAYFQQ